MTKLPTELASDEWMKHPLVVEAVAKIKEGHVRLLESLLFATFTEGAKYASQRCVDAGHGDKP